MSFWNGTRWVDEAGSRSVGPRPRGRFAHLADVIATAGMAIGLVALFFPFAPTRAAGPSLAVSPGSGVAGTIVQVVGTDFQARTRLQITWDDNPSGMPSIQASRSGKFTARIVIPVDLPGSHVVAVTESIAKGKKPASQLAGPPSGAPSAAAQFIVTANEPGPDPTSGPSAAPTLGATAAPTGTSGTVPTSPPSSTPASTPGSVPTPGSTPPAETPPAATPGLTPAPTVNVTPTPTLAPTARPTAAPTPAPTNAEPGWRLIFNDDFLTPVAEGQFPAAVGLKWGAYPKAPGWDDTSNNGIYDPSIISIHDGTMDIFIRTVAGVHLVATAVPKLPQGTGWMNSHQLYGRYAIRAKVDSMHGYKAAWLLWPISDIWPRDGEIDFPEGDFDTYVSAYMHHQGATSGSDQDAFPTQARWTDWHTYVTEWTPTSVKFYLDGALIGTSTQRIPNTPMSWRIQNETTLDGFVPADSVSGHILIDSVSVWAYVP